MKLSDSEEHLIRIATEWRKKAYAPYSKYKVGVALFARDELGDPAIYGGANVETCVHHTSHAERVAIDQAVLEGYRNFVEIAVVTDDRKIAYPCGLCLQDLTEFDDGSGRLKIIAVNLKGDVRKSTLRELLPERFGPVNLGVKTE